MNLLKNLRFRLAALLVAVLAGFPRTRILANDQVIEIAIANGAAEMADPDAEGWTLLAKYGDWPHVSGVVQRLNKSAAESLANSLSGAMARVKRFFTGASPAIPVYHGHPDDPFFASHGHEDRNAYAKVTELKPGQDGIYGRIDWTEAGQALRREVGKLFFSPRWSVLPTGDKKILTPTTFLSFGLTPTPNIPGAPANSLPVTETKTETTVMNETQLNLLRAALKLDASADASAIFAKANAVIAAHGKLETDLSNANTSLADTEKARKAAVDRADAERKKLATIHVDQAIANGRVLPASKEAEVLALCNSTDFDAAVTNLEKRDVVLKTASNSRTSELGKRKGEAMPSAKAKEAEGKFLALVNAKITTACDRDAAWALVKATPEGQRLWEEWNEKDQPAA
jgi:hypothetical protein